MTGPAPAPGAVPEPGSGGIPFDDFPERYARFDTRRDRLYPAIGEWLRAQLPGGARAVDLGCGEGRLTAMLADRYRQVLAVDVSAGMLALARARHPRENVLYQQRGVMEVTPDRDGTFAAVLSVNVLHHAGPPATVLPWVRRLVAPGGRAVLVDLVDPGGWGTDPDWHVTQAFTAARTFFQRSGGDPEAAVDALQLLLHPRWLKMMVTDIPPTRDEFHRHAAAAFPGAVFADDLHPVLCGLAWQAPPGDVVPTG